MNKSEVEVAKSIGIILVVLGHIAQAYVPYPNVYWYHMPLFFMISGFSLRGGGEFRKAVEKSAEMIWRYVLPYVVIYYSVLMIAYHFGWQSFGAENLQFYELFTGIFTSNTHHVKLILPLWFMVALSFAWFTSYIVITFLGKWSKKVVPVLIVLFAFFGMVTLARAFHISQLWIFGLAAQTFAGAAFILFGWWANNVRLLDRLQNPVFPVIALLLVIQLIKTTSSPMMANSSYQNWWTALVVGVAMSLIVLIMSREISKTRLSLIGFVGRYSRSIMTHHLFAFYVLSSIFSVLGLYVVQGDVFTIYNPNILWPAYMAVGIFVPIFIAVCSNRALAFLRMRVKAEK